MNTIEILLAEDDQLDIIDIKRSLEKLKIVYNLTNAKNGEEALALLHERKNNGQALPDIVLIDINMPKMNGLELLTEIRRDESLKSMKCFIVTSSDESVDRKTAEKLGVSGYLLKPMKLNGTANLDTFNLMIDLMNFRAD